MIGDQDERMFMYFEDVDWCYRLKEKNLQIYYFPEFRAIHYGGQTTSRRSWTMHRIYQKSCRIFCKKYIYPRHNFIYNLFFKFFLELKYILLFFARFIFNIKFVGGGGYKKQQQKTS